jgi:hypothetical protein
VSGEDAGQAAEAGFAIQQAIPAYPQVAASYTPVQGYFRYRRGPVSPCFARTRRSPWPLPPSC